jgi:CBS domain-containing protein
MQTVASIMSREVATAEPGTPLSTVAGLLAARAISCVVVCEGRQPVGILSERDLVHKVVAPGRDTGALRARDVMSAPVLAVPGETTTLEALEVLRGRHFRRLPVVDTGGLLAGIVTQTDLVQGLLAFLRENTLGDAVHVMMQLGARGSQQDEALSTLTRRCHLLETRCAEILEFLYRTSRRLEGPAVDLGVLAHELADTTRAVESLLHAGPHDDSALRDAVERAESSLRRLSTQNHATLTAVTERVQRVEELLEQILQVAFPTAGTA